MRTPKKKLFRRGKTQKYPKIVAFQNSAKAVMHTHSQQNRLPFFTVLVILIACGTSILLIPSVLSNLVSFLMGFKMPNIPQLTLPQIVFPKISLSIPPIALPTINLVGIQLFIQHSLVTFISTFSAFNPITILHMFGLLLQYTYSLQLTYFRWGIELLTQIFYYLDPRPGFTITIDYVAFFIKSSISLLLNLISYVNPIPVIIINIKIQLTVLLFISKLFLQIFLTILTVSEMIIHLILTIVFVIGTLIANFFSIISHFIQGILSGIESNIKAVTHFFAPYINFFSRSFTSALHELSISWDTFIQVTHAITERYNTNQAMLLKR